MSEEGIKKILADILKSDKKTEDVAEEEYIREMVKRFNQPHLLSFANYLEEDCGLTPKVIAAITTKLMMDAQVQQFLGAKIIRIWLLYKTFEIMDILPALDQAIDKKRIILKNLFNSFVFPGANLELFLRACCKAIGEGEEDINDLIQLAGENREEFITKAFRKPDPPRVPVQQVVYNADKSIQEQLNDLISDYQQLPKETFEQYLMAATILAYVEKHPDLKMKLNSIQPPLPFEELKINIVSTLKEQCKKQNGNITSDKEESFRKIIEKINVKKDEAYDELRALQTKISSINVFELERLIIKTQKSKKMIEDKDVLLMIGNTGSGKSTNILKFLGYDLKQGKQGNLSTLVPTRDPDQDHKSFYTSPEAKSCTRYINAVPVPDKMYKAGTAQNKKTLVICDTPGFGDSAGFQVDIANGVGMINALYGARSVRVVIILPYDSLLGDRMAGAVKMSEIIANLFNDLTVLDCMAIYFNKVPKKMVKELPKLIEDKLKHLTESQKSFEKLTMFLNEMQKRAQDQSNFIDPLNGDYQQLFNSLLKLNMITQVKDTFRYDFTNQTKKQIERFLLAEKSKVTQRFNTKKYEKAAYHFKIIEKLRENLPDHNKVEQAYRELTKFILDEIEKMYNTFDELVNQIVECKQTDKTSQKIAETNKQISIITQILGKNQSLKISNTKIDELISSNREKLMSQFQDITNVTFETIQSVKSFSELLDLTLKRIILSKIEEGFDEYHAVVKGQVKLRKFSEMKNNLTVISRLAIFAQELTSKTDKSPLIEQLNNLKDELRSKASSSFQQISISALSEKSVITEQVLSEVRLKLSQIKAIDSLSFLGKEDNIGLQLSTTFRKLCQKCRLMIRQLEDLNMSLDDDIHSKTALDNKKLSSKKKQIELLMKIDGVGEELTVDYEYSKAKLQNKLRDNVQTLKQYLKSLKESKGEDVLKNIKEIRKAAMIVLQCSKIIKGAQSNEKLTNEIQQSFERHIKIEIEKLKLFQVRLTNQETISKVHFQIEKIKSFGKMSFFGEKIEALMNDLKSKFGQKLRTPLKTFLLKEAAYIEDRKHYQYIPFIINKIQSLTVYIVKVKQMLEYDEQTKIIEDQLAILAKMKQVYRQIDKDTESFQEYKYEHKSYPIYLKELIKTLLKINEKLYYSQYLAQHQNLQPSAKLNIINIKLQHIQKQIEEKFLVYHNTVGQLQNLQDLIADCKFYSDIEQLMKTEDFGFKHLHEKCLTEFKQHLTYQESSIKHLISDIEPSKIDFAEVQQLYIRFDSMKSNDGDQKRKLLVSQLKQKEHAMLTKLSNNQLNTSNSDHDYSEDKYHDYMETFQETMILVNRIKGLYTVEEDKGKIVIDQSKLKRISAGIIRIFQGEFSRTKEQLEDYNFGPIIDKSIQSFKVIEDKLIQIFDLESQNEDYNDVSRSMLDKPDDFSQNRIRLKIFIQKNTTILREKIIQSPFANKPQINNSKRLSELLTILKEYTDKQTSIKYRQFGPLFKVDEGFESFYSAVAKNKHQRLDFLKDNVKLKMNQLFERFRQEFNGSAQRMQAVQTEISQTIRFLPTELRSIYRQDQYKLKKSLFEGVQSFIKEISKDIFTNYVSLDKFFKQSNKANRCGQKNIHKMFVQAFQEMYTAVESTLPEMQVGQKISFFSNTLVKLYQSHKAYIDEDILMLNILKQKFKLWLRVLKKSGEASFSTLEAMFDKNSPNSQEGNTQRHEIDYHAPVNDIFKILNVVNQLSNEGGIDDLTATKAQIINAFEKAISKFIQAHSVILLDKPAYKLNSSDILERTPMAKVQEYVKCVKLSQSILQIFKGQIERFQNSQVGDKKYFQQINNINLQDSALKGYSEQISEMIKVINSFTFYTNIKRNMSSKEIEQQLIKLDLSYEILSVRSEFFKSIIDNPRQLDFSSLTSCLNNKLTAFIAEANQEITGIFSPRSENEEGRLNFLLRTLTAVRSKERQLKFLPSSQANDIYTSLSKEIKTNFSKLTDQFARVSSNATKQFLNHYKYPEQDIRALADVLFTYQKALLDIEGSEDYKNEFDKMMHSLQNSPTLAMVVGQKLNGRNDDKRSIGKSITSKKSVVASNQQTLPNMEQIALMMQKIGKDFNNFAEDEMKRMRKAINCFKDKYDSSIGHYMRNSNEETIGHMVITLKDLGKQLSKQFYQANKSRKGLQDKVNLLAGLMALLVIIKSGGNMQPYLTQLFAVVLLLGLTTKEEQLGNRLAQIPPGEGKSTILACLIAYLALVGFKVRCLCYNKYLRNRDSLNFKELYEKLGVQGQIRYATIEQLCLEQLRENTTNFAKTTTFLTSNLKQPQNEIIGQEFMHTILVVDDISVFFQDEYYGKTFSPTINLRGKEVTGFLRLVWNQVKQHGKQANTQTIIKSQQFKSLSLRYINLEEQLKRQVSGMINDAVNHHHNYKLQDKRIVYSKANQRLNGYKTVFAHLHQNQLGRISAQSLQKALQINLTVGEFSYASLRKSFTHVLTVTGTIDLSSPIQKQFAKQMANIYFMPSAYPSRQKIIQAYIIAPSESFNSCLMDRIKAVRDSRPIIILFKDQIQMEEFKESQVYKTIAHQVNIISEGQQNASKQSIIQKATLPGSITLMPKSFGRGTHFQILDQRVRQSEGLHIIQAFLSLDEGEELEIKSRAARLTNRGSYDCVFNEGEFEVENLKATSIIGKIAQARKQRIANSSQTLKEMVDQANNKHEQMRRVYSSCTNNMQQVYSYISELNHCSQLKEMTIKTIIGIDASSSMIQPLKKLILCINPIFQRANVIIRNTKINAAIEIKVIAYRDYNYLTDKIIESTDFEQNSTNVRAFLQSLDIQRLYNSRLAVEVLLQVVNREKDLDQVIVIGNTSPNMPDQIPRKRKQSKLGENGWNNNGFPMTTLEEELTKLQQRGCPVHSCYLRGSQVGFNKMAKYGTAAQFQVNHKNFERDMIDFIVERILQHVELKSSKPNLKLVEMYKKSSINQSMI